MTRKNKTFLFEYEYRDNSFVCKELGMEYCSDILEEFDLPLGTNKIWFVFGPNQDLPVRIGEGYYDNWDNSQYYDLCFDNSFKTELSEAQKEQIYRKGDKVSVWYETTPQKEVTIKFKMKYSFNNDFNYLQGRIENALEDYGIYDGVSISTD